MNLDWSPCLTPYNRTTVDKYAPFEGGVYLLWVKSKNRGWYCFYAGKAKNLEEGLLVHHLESEPDERIKKKVKFKCAFQFAEIATEEERSGVEKYLINQYKPDCNDVEAHVSPIKIELPPDPNA